MKRKNDYIAVFDSGVGGISVLRELVKEMPDERFLYFGDSKNAPYGVKEPEEIRQLTLSGVEALLTRGVKAVVVACNTATAAAIEDLRQTYKDLIIVGIEPALKVAADTLHAGTVGVMATPATLHLERFHNQAARFPQLEVVPIAAPGLVELVEAGQAESKACEEFLRPILSPYAGKLDALVLGCTHYPFAASAIRRILGEKTLLLDGGAGTARHTRHRLEAEDLLNPGPGEVIIENSRNTAEILNLAKLLYEGKETKL